MDAAFCAKWAIGTLAGFQLGPFRVGLTDRYGRTGFAAVFADAYCKNEFFRAEAEDVLDGLRIG